jgi:hypothetical protein
MRKKTKTYLLSSAVSVPRSTVRRPSSTSCSPTEAHMLGPAEPRWNAGDLGPRCPKSSLVGCYGQRSQRRARRKTSYQLLAIGMPVYGEQRSDGRSELRRAIHCTPIGISLDRCWPKLSRVLGTLLSTQLRIEERRTARSTVVVLLPLSLPAFLLPPRHVHGDTT